MLVIYFGSSGGGGLRGFFPSRGGMASLECRFPWYHVVTEDARVDGGKVKNVDRNIFNMRLEDRRAVASIAKRITYPILEGK